MEVLDLEFEKWYELVLRFNWLIVLGIITVLVIVPLSIKIYKKKSKKTIHIDEMKLGLGSSEIVLKYDYSDRELAYKIWVEMESRKVGLQFDIKNDVIVEVYKSWYDFFGLTRKCIEDLPGKRLDDSSDLVNLCLKVLNDGMRPHLTEWQAKFKRWYEHEAENNDHTITPQEIQRKYPKYSELEASILSANAKLMEFKFYLHQIAFGKK